MKESESKALVRVAETLEKAAQNLRELAASPNVRSPKRASLPLPDVFMEELRTSDRSVAVSRLAELSHQQLGQVFARLGGVSREKKRSKAWLIERILWHLFDFQAGHKIIKQ